MSAPQDYVAWERGGWRGIVRVDARPMLDALIAVAMEPPDTARRSRHALTFPARAAGRHVWVKRYPRPGARFARRSFRMQRALRTAGFETPEIVLVAFRTTVAVVVSDDAGGVPLALALARAARAEKRRLLAALGREVGRLHRAGFVAGDLVPSNVLVRDGRFVLLDHDRTRRSRALVWWHGRRNLVQLGRFVVPGVTVTDRARVLRAYAAARGWSAARQRRLARWLVGKITARRIRIDGMDGDAANAAGFRAVMRSGGPFDPGGRAGS